MTVKAKELPSQDILKRLFDYNPETGDLFYKERTLDLCKTIRGLQCFNGRFANKKASYMKDGYIVLKYDGVSYRAHRICYKIYYGEISSDMEIDHINGVRCDNRILNLRMVRSTENRRNSSIPRNNSSGHIGVKFSKKKNLWISTISNNSKTIYLGEFKLLEDAIKSRMDAEVKYGYHKNHGRNLFYNY